MRYSIEPCFATKVAPTIMDGEVRAILRARGCIKCVGAGLTAIGIFNRAMLRDQGRSYIYGWRGTCHFACARMHQMSRSGLDREGDNPSVTLLRDQGRSYN